MLVAHRVELFNEEKIDGDQKTVNEVKFDKRRGSWITQATIVVGTR